jgi:hypothetical protein
MTRDLAPIPSSTLGRSLAHLAPRTAGGRLPADAPRGAYRLPSGAIDLSGVVPQPTRVTDRRPGRLGRLAGALAGLLALIACAQPLPTAPSAEPSTSPVQHSRTMADLKTGDAEIDAGLDLIDQDGRSAFWTHGASVRAWFLAQPIDRIVRGAGEGNAAEYSTLHREIRYSGYGTPQPAAVMAAVLLHEARHAEGYPHTCQQVYDQTEAEGGAWAVQVAAFERYGEPDRARVVRSFAFCE